ncbi:MAG: hypothetical protein H6726_17600 [Sandaracinaceae bacterium]|nr:hypothetical protein [Sandaracinaceae bacterium]
MSAASGVRRLPAVLVVLGVTAFVALTGASAASYSGGSGADPNAPGYSWVHNYWCDLYRDRALDGADHRTGALLAQVGALGAVLAIFCGFWCAGGAFGERDLPRARRATRALAAVACLALIAIPLTPADRYGRLHFLVVGLAAGPALVAFTLAAAALARAERTLRLLTAVAYGASLLHFGHYLAELFGGPAWGAGIAAEQKLVTGLDLAWLLVVALTTRRRAPGASPS